MKSHLFIFILLLIVTPRESYPADIEGGFTHQGQYRRYLVHTPPQYADEDSVPLVLNLHWGGGTPQGQANFCGMNEKSDSAGFIVVYPEGTMMSYGWLGWNSSQCLESDVDDVDFISQLIDTLEVSYRIDTLRIFATGFCNGAMMVHKLACELSDRIAASAPVAAGLTEDNWSSCQPSRPVSIMHFHARNDPSVPYYGGSYYNCDWPAVDSFMNFWSQKLACDLGPDSFYNDKGALRQRWTRSDDSCELVLWTTEDGSHYWPGSPWGSQAIDANDEMWEFFKAHPMPVEEPEPGIEESREPACVLDPSNPTIFTKPAAIHFSIEKAGHVSLMLFDVQGRKIAVLLEQRLEAGSHEVVIDAARLPRGVYFYQLKTPAVAVSKPIILIK